MWSEVQQWVRKYKHQAWIMELEVPETKLKNLIQAFNNRLDQTKESTNKPEDKSLEIRNCTVAHKCMQLLIFLKEWEKLKVKGLVEHSSSWPPCSQEFQIKEKKVDYCFNYCNKSFQIWEAKWNYRLTKCCGFSILDS